MTTSDDDGQSSSCHDQAKQKGLYTPQRKAQDLEPGDNLDPPNGRLPDCYSNAEKDPKSLADSNGLHRFIGIGNSPQDWEH